MKTAKQIAIWNGCDNHPELEDVITAMDSYGKELSIGFKQWHDKLKPSDKVSVWSEAGSQSGLFTMSDNQLFNKYLETLYNK